MSHCGRSAARSGRTANSGPDGQTGNVPRKGYVATVKENL